MNEIKVINKLLVISFVLFFLCFVSNLDHLLVDMAMRSSLIASTVFYTPATFMQISFYWFSINFRMIPMWTADRWVQHSIFMLNTFSHAFKCCLEFRYGFSRFMLIITFNHIRIFKFPLEADFFLLNGFQSFRNRAVFKLILKSKAYEISRLNWI